MTEVWEISFLLSYGRAHDRDLLCITTEDYHSWFSEAMI